MVGQTTNDGIVLANTSLLQKNWCAAGANLSMYWNDQGTGGLFVTQAMAHMNAAWVDALPALAFISDSFYGGSTAPVTSCSVTPPVPPYGG